MVEDIKKQFRDLQIAINLFRKFGLFEMPALYASEHCLTFKYWSLYAFEDSIQYDILN